MVPGVPNAIPSFQVIEILGLRLLPGVLPSIADAMAPGGSGNPFKALTAGEQATLLEITKLGFPLRGWWQYAALNGGAFLAVEPVVSILDSSYFTDFFTVSGYEGTLPAVQAAHISQYATTITSLSGSSSLVLASVPTGYLDNADLTVTSGPLQGQTLPILSVSGNTITLAAANTGLVAGNTVTLDNSRVLALEYYPRHQVPTPDEYGWNQYRNAQGNPIYPQRPFLVGPILDASSSGGAVATGHFYGKMIMLASTMDVQAYSWSADWYKGQAKSVFGADLGQNYRIWYMDNADHDPDAPAVSTAPKPYDHIVPYTGEFEQALLDLDAWVASGTTPPASSNYQVDSYDNIQVPQEANGRGGVQPAVTLSAGGYAKLTVGPGQAVPLSVTATMPPQATGNIVTVEWDLQGTGNFSPPEKIAPSTRKITLYKQTKFTSAGTYFPVVRITAQNDGLPTHGNKASPYCLIQNLSGVRVVVK